MSPQSRELSVVIPVYRSASNLHSLIARLEAVLPKVSTEFEVVLVDDGSPDESWAVIQQLAAEKSWVRGLQHMRNYGQHSALLLGIRSARHSVIVTVDDDLEHPPEELPKLLAKLDEGPDVVYGRPDVEQHGFLRNVASRITKFALQKAMGAEVARNVSAFRVFRTHLRRAFEGYRGAFVSIDVLLTWGTTRFAAVTVRHDPRAVGDSNYTFRKLVTHAMNMMTGFSTFPLQIASLVGFTFTLIGLVLLVYVIAVYFIYRESPPGFAFLASMIALFSGAQLFAMGILGEYLARMHSRSMDRPAYTVRSDTEAE